MALEQVRGEVDCNKLVKLMYLADKEALKGDRWTITGDDYCALPKGLAARQALAEPPPALQAVGSQCASATLY